MSGSKVSSTISGAPAIDLQALARRVEGPDRVAEFRRLALDAYGGKIPAAAQVEYSQALLTLEAPKNRLAEFRAGESGITVAKKSVVTLETQLGRVEADNKRIYESSLQTIRALQTQLGNMLDDRRIRGDDRVGAFFQIVANNERQQRLNQSWGAYEKKQLEFHATLDGLKATEVLLSGAASPAEALSDDALVLAAFRQRGVEQLRQNLEEQIALLKQMITFATGANHALRGVQTELEASLAATNAWAAQLRAEVSDQLLSRVFDIASFLTALALPASALPALSVIRGILLQDVEGVRESAELFVWRAVSRLLTRGLIDAGVGEVAARTLVGALREGARWAATNERADAAAVIAAAGRGSLSEAQSFVLDFLTRQADEALPLATLARAVLGAKELSSAEARGIVASLSQVGGGVDGALRILEASVR